MTEIFVVLCTCPDEAVAEVLAEGLVAEKLAACVNVLPAIRSIYRWQGQLQKDNETLMIIKTTRAASERLVSWLEEHHPYDVPEILALPAIDGSPAYTDWVLQACEGGMEA